jgi:hypothetical protein
LKIPIPLQQIGRYEACPRSRKHQQEDLRIP